MSNAWRAAVGSAAVVIVIGLFLLLREDDSTPTSDTRTTPATTTVVTATAQTETGETTTEETATEETTTEQGPTQLQVNVPPGGPQKVQRLEARRGDRIELVVTMGFHDDVHVHGYDLLLHTGPGLPPARFDFVATTPGRFEIETEGTHQQIAELRVRP